MTKTVLAFAGLAASLLLLSACQSSKAPANPGGSGKSASLRVMEQVAIAAHKCWIASKDPAFKSYSMANELNNFGGTPRFLLVPKNNYGGKPLLVGAGARAFERSRGVRTADGRNGRLQDRRRYRPLEVRRWQLRLRRLTPWREVLRSPASASVWLRSSCNSRSPFRPRFWRVAAGLHR